MVETEAWAELDPGTGKAEDRGQVTHTIQSLHKQWRFCSASACFLLSVSQFFFTILVCFINFSQAHITCVYWSNMCRRTEAPLVLGRGSKGGGYLAAGRNFAYSGGYSEQIIKPYPPTRDCVTVRNQE